MKRLTTTIPFFWLELETEAKEAFREFLIAMKYKDIERFFNEWKMTFESDGPFTSEQDLGNLEKAMTDPDDFMVGTPYKALTLY